MDKKATLNRVIPTMTFESTNPEFTSLKDLRGKNVVLYFYPKDSTPGCTREANDFKANIKAFAKLNTVVVGVSRDSIKSHHNFINKFDLPFDLISDPDETVCQCFDVVQLKKLYGREYMGIVRSTVLIGEDGKLKQEWRNIKVKGHVDSILEHLKAKLQD